MNNYVGAQTHTVTCTHAHTHTHVGTPHTAQHHLHMTKRHNCQTHTHTHTHQCQLASNVPEGDAPSEVDAPKSHVVHEPQLGELGLGLEGTEHSGHVGRRCANKGQEEAQHEPGEGTIKHPPQANREC